MKKNKIFISYSHKDKILKNLMEPFLKSLEMAGYCTIWHDDKIKCGDDWEKEIENTLQDAGSAILLLSPDFLASDYIMQKELPVLLERKKKQSINIFPFLLRNCSWEINQEIKKLLVRPEDGKPLSDYDKSGKDAVLTAFVKEIADILKGKKLVKKNSTKTKKATRDTCLIENISLSRLPNTGKEFLGRKKELKLLDKAWSDDHTHIVSLVAFGGVGKTALVKAWLKKMKRKKFKGAEMVYAWSFYSQGTRETENVSADLFIEDALEFFGDGDPERGSARDKGERLAQLVRKRKSLLILDGLEPLQYAPGAIGGCLKDKGLQAFLKSLAYSLSGLCIITSRLPVKDLDDQGNEEGSLVRKNLEQLNNEDGAHLLQKLGVNAPLEELKKATGDLKGHALALTLFGRLISIMYEGDLRKMDLLPGLMEEETEGDHARRVMAAYERKLKGQLELVIIYMMGLFDRPVPSCAMNVLKEELLSGTGSELAKLRNLLKKSPGPQKVNNKKWSYALQYLREFYLLTPENKNRDASDNKKEGVLDCHPLVREYFGERFRKLYPHAWEKAHAALYQYYRDLPEKELPDNLEEMEPLFAAVSHGCRAGFHREVFTEIYWKRIKRKDEEYTYKKLGAFGADLAALSYFFEQPWTRPVTALFDADKAIVLNYAGLGLRGLGRLIEAAGPMEAGLKLQIEKEDWKNAAIGASSLSEIYLVLGKVKKAVEMAKKSVVYADQSGELYLKYTRLTTLADALHQSGRRDEAATLFTEAEALQKSTQSQYPFLYSIWGYRFCDLLLGIDENPKTTEVLERAAKTLEWAEKKNLSLLAKALDKLSLGRAFFFQAIAHGGKKQEEKVPDFTQAKHYLDEAVSGLRESGNLDDLPRGLLALAGYFREIGEYQEARNKLDEVKTIAAPNGMKLYMVDYQLEAARLSLAQGEKNEARKHRDLAFQLINETGYYRRLEEVKMLGAANQQ